LSHHVQGNVTISYQEMAASPWRALGTTRTSILFVACAVWISCLAFYVVRMKRRLPTRQRADRSRRNEEQKISKALQTIVDLQSPQSFSRTHSLALSGGSRYSLCSRSTSPAARAGGGEGGSHGHVDLEIVRNFEYTSSEDEYETRSGEVRIYIFFTYEFIYKFFTYEFIYKYYIFEPLLSLFSIVCCSLYTFFLSNRF